MIFTPLAERHIDSLHEYIAVHASEERADGYVGRIVDFCNGLSTFPLRGTQRDDLLSGLRVTGFERRVTIAFIVTAEAVLIEGIFLWRPGLRGGVSRSHVKFICAETLAYRDSHAVRARVGEGRVGGSATGCLGNGYFRLEPVG